MEKSNFLSTQRNNSLTIKAKRKSTECLFMVKQFINLSQSQSKSNKKIALCQAFKPICQEFTYANHFLWMRKLQAIQG